MRGRTRLPTYRNRPVDCNSAMPYKKRRWGNRYAWASDWIETIVAKEIQKIPEDLSEDQLIDLRISVLQKLDAAIADKLARGGASAATPNTAPNLVLARLPTQDAIVAYLRSAKDPKKVSQITRALVEAGHHFVSEDPMTAIKTGIRRVATINPDVVYVGSGKWTLESIHSPARLKKLKEKNGGRGGHSPSEHIRRTKEGMIAKGLTFGRKPKFGPDDIAKFRKLVDNKTMRPIAALKECGISTPYYYTYKPAIYAWRPGDPWPPPGGFPRGRGVSGDELRAMGIIPLHARVIGEDK